MKHSAISWTDHTWNPWIGCTKVSPACDHCYAEAWAKRYGRAEWGNNPRERTSAATWKQPYKWARETPGAFVFCASLADIFDNQVDPQWRADAFTVMRETPTLTYLLLTKRPQNIDPLSGAAGGLPENAAIGCTIVTQEEVNRDVPKLLAAASAVHPRFTFVSVEPMLGAVGLWEVLSPTQRGCVNWVICGGESGPHHRAVDAWWVADLRDQCISANVPFHFKQWGGFTPKANGKTLDGREWCERPRAQAGDPE